MRTAASAGTRLATATCSSTAHLASRRRRVSCRERRCRNSGSAKSRRSSPNSVCSWVLKGEEDAPRIRRRPEAARHRASRRACHVSRSRSAPIKGRSPHRKTAVQRRRALSLCAPDRRPVWPPVKAWTIDTYKGLTRRAAYATTDGKRAAIVLIPDKSWCMFRAVLASNR